MKNKLCPLMSRVVYWYPGGSVEDQGPELYKVECVMTKCEFWTRAYNTPIEQGAYTTEGCALRINAMKNSEGRVPI